MTATRNARLLKNIPVAGEMLVLGWLLATEDLSSIGLLLLGISAALGLIVIISKGWPLGAVLVLAVSSAMPRFAGTVLGLHVRSEHVAIALAVLVVLLQLSSGRLRVSFNLEVFDYFLIAYIALNFLTSAATSPEPRMTLRWAALNAIAISPYFLLRILVRDEPTLFKTLRVLLWVGAAESAYGIVCFLSNHVFNTTFGIEAAQYGFTSGTYGTQWEANLFGSYTACCAIMFLALFLLSHESRHAQYGWGFAVTALGALISLARSVFLALPFAALLVVWIALKKGQFRLRRLIPLVLKASLLLLAVSPFFVSEVRERFSTIDIGEVSADNTTWERLVQMAVAIEDVKAHPTLGTGTASFHLFFDPNDFPAGFAGDEEEPGWISNSPLRILHDTGAVGLIAFLFFVAYLTIAIRNAARNDRPRTTAILTALFAGGVLYAITFQATEATMLAFTWIHLGLLAAAVAILQETPRPLEAREAR